jgi:GcrA cell cycle regulator
LFSESNRDSVFALSDAAVGQRTQRRVRAAGLPVAAARVQFVTGEATVMSRYDPTWSPERVNALKRFVKAGLSCSRIANEIGVSRNAVIGKINRLGLSRPKDVIKRPAPRKTPKAAGIWRQAPPRPALVTANETVAVPEPAACEELLIPNGRECTLLELGAEKCRWPISTPGAPDFCFCGNEPVKGLPYCLGHARLAYRRPDRGGQPTRAA